MGGLILLYMKLSVCHSTDQLYSQNNMICVEKTNEMLLAYSRVGQTEKERARGALSTAMRERQ